MFQVSGFRLHDGVCAQYFRSLRFGEKLIYPKNKWRFLTKEIGALKLNGIRQNLNNIFLYL